MTNPRNSQEYGKSLSRPRGDRCCCVRVLRQCTAPVQAQDFAIAAQAGTTGLGGGVVLGLTPKVNARMPCSAAIPTDYPSFSIDDIDFEISSFPSLLAHDAGSVPASAAFHLSGGGLLITNDWDLDVEWEHSMGGAVDIGGMSLYGRPTIVFSEAFTEALPAVPGNRDRQPHRQEGSASTSMPASDSARPPSSTVTAEGPLADAHRLQGSTLPGRLLQQEVGDDIQDDIPESPKVLPRTLTLHLDRVLVAREPSSGRQRAGSQGFSRSSPAYRTLR